MIYSVAELKQQIIDLYINYVGGAPSIKIKQLLTNIVDNMGTSTNFTITEVPKTANFTVADADTFKLYVIDSATAVTITLPSGLTAGNWWEFISIGIGKVTFVASGSTIISPDNRLVIRAKNSYVRAIARASNQISLGGDLVL